MPRSGFLAATTTFAPLVTNAFAAARPMPVVPPEISAAFPRWAHALPRERVGDGRRYGRARAPLQLEPVPVLPLAAERRRIQPCDEPLDHDRNARRRKNRGAMVHHAERSHPRGTHQA